jgi:hypothetical protein
MDDPYGSIEDGIQLDLALARLQLAEAQQAREDEDTPSARRQVAAALALADSLLDMWNDVLVTTA